MAERHGGGLCRFSRRPSPRAPPWPGGTGRRERERPVRQSEIATQRDREAERRWADWWSGRQTRGRPTPTPRGPRASGTRGGTQRGRARDSGAREIAGHERSAVRRCVGPLSVPRSLARPDRTDRRLRRRQRPGSHGPRGHCRRRGHDDTHTPRNGRPAADERTPRGRNPARPATWTVGLGHVDRQQRDGPRGAFAAAAAAAAAAGTSTDRQREGT